MSSKIYLTQQQIHQLFSICDLNTNDVKHPEIAPFREVEQSLDISEFEYESCKFCSDSKKEDYYTTNNTNRFPSQDSIFVVNDENTVKISKLDYENLKRDALCYQSLVQNNKELKTHKWLVNQTKSYKSQIYILQENIKKSQKHIYDLLQNIKSIENENFQYQDDILQLRLQLQDQLKIIQQCKIDQERLKISIIQKDEAYIKLKVDFDNLAKDFKRSKNCKSVQRNSYSTTKTSNPLIKGLSNTEFKNYCNRSFNQ